MQKLLKYTYLLDINRIDKRLIKLWTRYQALIKKPDWQGLNEARALLYLLGQVYCEQIAPEAISRRLHLLKKPLKLPEFFIAVDSESKNLKLHRQDKLFVQLERFYILVKKFKNRAVGGRYYLDEEKFIRLYNKYNPQKKFKIGYRGGF